MKLFTVVLDYQGGTYLWQAESNSIEELCVQLDEAINWSTLPLSMSKRTITQFTSDIRSSRPVALDGLRNAWCMSAMLGKKLAILHFIETSA